MRKKSLPIEDVSIDKLVHGGQGLGVLPDGRKCFVWGALPGEEVSVQLTKKKKDWAEGYVLEIKKASFDRIAPAEPDMYLATSPWQIVDYAKEAEAKQLILEETFVREGIATKWLPFYQQDQPYGYRNKMEYNFWFDNESEKVSLALHRRGSHQKVAVTGSALASDIINQAGKELIAYINNNNIEARPLKSVILRSDSNGTAGVSIFVNEKSAKKLFANYKPNNTIVEIVYSNPKSPASISTEVLLPAEQQLSDTLLGKTFTYSTRSFFQVNVPTYQKVLSIISDAVNAAEQSQVVDMYSGVGTIGLSTVDDSKFLRLVEIDKESVEQARQNSKDRINCDIVLATAESSVDYITGDEIVILDPPRAGLHSQVTARIIHEKPKDIIYLSCNPSTQARDIKALLAAGYKITYAQGFNFFPRTPHIESLIILRF